MVDQRQRFAHRESVAPGVEHLGVAGVDRHARADGCLRQIDRRDVAALQVGQGHRQFRFEGRNELAAGGQGRVPRAPAADQDDAGGEGVGAYTDHSIAEFRAHRPSAGDRETGLNHGIQEGLPTGAGSAPIPFLLGLLEGVVDGDREAGVGLSSKTLHRLSHPGQKKGLRLLLVPMPVWSGDQFFGLRHGERGEQVREYRFQGAAQPDIEEIGQVGVADVVVVGRIGGGDLVLSAVL